MKENDRNTAYDMVNKFYIGVYPQHIKEYDREYHTLSEKIARHFLFSDIILDFQDLDKTLFHILSHFFPVEYFPDKCGWNVR